LFRNPDIIIKKISADLTGDPVEVTQYIIKKLNNLDISVLFFNAGFGVYEV
jgi:short-subunit dehydrogenase